MAERNIFTQNNTQQDENSYENKGIFAGFTPVGKQESTGLYSPSQIQSTQVGSNGEVYNLPEYTLPSLAEVVEANSEKTWDITNAVNSRFGNFVRSAYQSAEAKDDLKSWEFASILSDIANVDIQFAKDNSKAIIQTFTGRDIDESTFATGLWNSFLSRFVSDYASTRATLFNATLGGMTERQRQIAIDNFVSNELHKMSSYWNPDMYGYKDSVLGKIAYFTAENLPSVIESQLLGLGFGAIGGVVASASAKSAINVLYNITRTASVFTKEAGSTLLSLYQTTDASGNRMSYEAITQASTMVGLVNTAFEFGLEKVLDTVGVKTMSALSRNVFKKFGKMSAKEISDTAIQTTAQYLKKGIKGNFLNALGEGTTEAMQTWSEDFFTNLAYKKSEGFGDYVKSNKDILKDMAETFAYTAASTFLEAPFLLGGGDDSFTFAGYLKNTRTGQVVSVKQARNYSTKTNDSTLVSTRNLNTYTNSKQTQYEQSSQGSEQSLKGNEETNRANRNARVYKIGTQYVPATVEDSNIIASYKDKTVAVYVDVVKDAKVEGTSLDLTSFKTQQKVIGELQGNVTKDLIIVSDKSFNDSLISLIKNNDVISIVFEKDGQVVDGNTGSYDKATLSIASDTGEINNFSIVNETYAKNNSITDFEAIEVSEVREDQQLRETALQNETNDRVKQYKKLTEKEMDSVFQETKKNYNKTTKGYLNKFQKNVQEKMFTLYKGQPNAKKNAKAISYAVTDLMARFAQINNTDVKTYIEARLGNVENSFINIMTEEDASKAQTRAFIERNADNTWTINLFNTPNSQTDIVHEFSHMFLSTLEDESVIDDFKRLYAEEFADGGILGAKFQEKFSNDLVNYMASGKVRDSKLKAVFDTILTALNNFAQFIRGMDFSQKTEVWQAFDKLFDTTKQAQERESQGQRLNNLASAIDKIDSTKLNSERLEDNELTSLLDDTKTFIEMIKSNELSNDEKAQAYDELYNTLEALKEGLLVLGSNDSQVENLLNQLGDEELSSLMANRPTSSLMYRKENSGLVFENKNGIINTGNNKSSEGFDEYAEQRIEYDGESGYETDDNSNRANDNRGLQADSQGQMRVSERHQYAMGLSTAGLQGTARRFEGNELRRGAGNYVGRPLANAKLTNLIKTKFNKKEVSDVAFVQLDKTVANMQYFSDKLEKARTGKFGYFVDGKSVEELMNPKTEVYLSDDGKTGFVIERDYHGHEGVNNIAGVFNYSEDGVKPKNGVVSVLINAIQQGGNALDCFADGLETMYAQIGFVPYAKNPFAVEYAIGDENWERDYLSKNKELPSVMAMYFAYNDINDYARNMKNIDIVSLFENVPIADDYDKMLDSRDEFVQQQKNNQQVAETNADPNIYTKNIDFIRDSETSVLVPYTTEQMVGRIRVGKPVDTSDIQTLLETDKNMTSYQRSVLTKEIEAIRTLTANPILYNTILDKYSQTKDYNLTYDEVMKAMKELDSNFKFESKRAGLELIKRAIAHSSWNTTESLNINFISSIKTNADLDSLALDLKRKGYLDKELVNRPA